MNKTIAEQLPLFETITEQHYADNHAAQIAAITGNGNGKRVGRDSL